MIATAGTVQAFLYARAQRPHWPGMAEDLRPTTIADGYALQRMVHDQLAVQGITRLGYKVGSTSASGQRAFGIQEPVYAGIFSDGQGNTLAEALDRPMTDPALECEIAVVLGKDITDPTADLVDTIASCHIACEIIDHRYGDPAALGVPSLIADDFFNAGFVIGPQNANWRNQDLTNADGSIEIDGDRTVGNARNVLSVFESLRWLVNKLASVGTHLRAGEIVLTGTLPPPTRITLPAKSVTLAITGFESLTLRR